MSSKAALMVGLIGDPPDPAQTGGVAEPGDEGVANEADTHITTGSRHDLSLGKMRNGNLHIPCSSVGNTCACECARMGWITDEQ